MVPWRAQDRVHCWLRRRASRPQLKRDPLGSRNKGHVYRPVLIALSVPYAGLTAWTIRRLWRHGDQPYERLVYRFGVRTLGLGFWAFMTVFLTIREPISSRSIWFSALIAAFVNLPIGLWVGYFWGHGMARFYGDDRTE